MKQLTTRAQKISVGVIAAVFMAASFISLVPANVVFAADKVPANDSSTNPDDWLPKTRATRWAYLTGLYNCMDDSSLGSQYHNSSQSDISSGNWWADPLGPLHDRFHEPAGYIDIKLLSDNSGKADCNVIVAAAAKAYSLSPLELFCQLGGKRNNGDSNCTGSATGAGFDWPSDNARLDVTKWWGTKTLPGSAGGAAYYALNYAALFSSQGCMLKADSSPDPKFAYTISVVDDTTGTITKGTYTGASRDWKKFVYTSYPGINGQERTCGTIASDLNKYSGDYALWVSSHDAAAANETKDGTGSTAEPTSCAVDGIGWIVCPVMNLMAKVNDSAFGFLTQFLTIRPALLTNDGTQNAWSAFRDIANVAFVIAFLVIVYSQLTSAGVSNYGIKKMLPRIVIAAILVNISYYVCELAVDISNIVGSSIYSLLKDSINIGGHVQNATWEDKTVGILAGVGAVGGVLLLALLVIIAPTSLLAFIVIILILVARQAFVILLVVMSPLAFVAYLLPNTESWFKKWWKAFMAVLMVYPIVGVVFGASTLASNILSSTAANTNDSNILQLIALGVLAVPLFAVPALLKGSLSAAGSVGQKLANLQDRANRRAGGDIKDRAGKEFKALGDSMTSRALNGEGRFGGILGSRARARARREKRYEGLDRQRKAAETVFGATDARASERERSALNAEETAGKTKQIFENEAKLDHLQQNGALHARSIESGLNLHNAEETHKNEVEAEHMRTNPNQYQALNVSRGEKQNAELETKRDFETSQVGRNQSMNRQMLEGQLDIERDEQKAKFEATGVGQAQAVEKDRVAQVRKATTSAAEEMAIELNEGARVNAAAAEQSVAAAKAGETALVEELKTEAGAAANPQYAAAAQQLNEADTVLRVQTQRSGAAKRVADVGYAKAIQDETTGLADIAGGVEGLTGVSQAKAVAHQTILDSYRKGVAAESTLMSEVREQDILGDTMLGADDILDQPDEKIAAMGSVIAKRQHMASHIKLWERMAELKAQTDAEVAAAEASGDPTQIATAKARAEKVSNMQQIVMADKSKKPFGIGDEAQGDATVGQYNKDIYDETRKRILTHMSPETLSTMDPDDLSLIFEMAKGGKLGPDHIKKVQEAYDAWKKNPNINSRLKDKAKALLDPFENFENGDANAFTSVPGYKDKFDDGVKGMPAP